MCGSAGGSADLTLIGRGGGNFDILGEYLAGGVCENSLGFFGI